MSNPRSAGGSLFVLDQPQVPKNNMLSPDKERKVFTAVCGHYSNALAMPVNIDRTCLLGIRGSIDVHCPIAETDASH
jgi:hypothetical protein